MLGEVGYYYIVLLITVIEVAAQLTVLQSGSEVIPVAFAGLWGGGALMTSPSSPTSVGLLGCPIGIPKNPEISGSSRKVH